MSKCIYCLKSEPKTSFFGAEHIIPQSLGGKSFPTISRDFICSNCNSNILSKLETGFKQDSMEGVYAQMLRIGGVNSVWIRGKNININTVCGFGDDFFNEIFPFLKIENNVPVFDSVAQLKVRNKSDGFQVFPLRTLEKARNADSQKLFSKIKARIAKASLKDLMMFSNSGDGTINSLDVFIALLKEYGVNYKEKQRKYIPAEKIKNKPIDVNWECKIDKDLMRVIAKIAFNYFAYCSIQEGSYYQNLPMGKNFDQIRNFIIKGTGDWKDIVRISKSKSILNIEGNGDKRVIAHTILFTNNNGVIIAKVSLFGIRVYEVTIGKYPFQMVTNNFGCGHTFDTFNKVAFSISPNKNAIKKPSDNCYGLFKI